MSTLHSHTHQNSSNSQVLHALNRDEVLVTMDIFFETMDARGCTNPIELYQKSREYAVKTFGLSENLAQILSGHYRIQELLRMPIIQQWSKTRKKVTTPGVQPVKPVITGNPVSHTKDTTEQKVRKALEHTPSPKEHFVELPVDVNSPPPDIEEAFRSGNMGMIARLLGQYDVEDVDVKGWGKMTTLPPPVDMVIGKVIQPSILNDLLNSYNQGGNFQTVTEIRKLQDGDVVNFKKLQRTLDGKYIRHFRIIKIHEVKVTNHDYEIHCVANCVFIKDSIAYEVMQAPLRIRVPNTGLKLGTLLRVYTDGGEFFQSKIDGPMSVYTNDTRAFKGGMFSQPRFII